MNSKPIVHVVDDDADFRKSVSRLLRLSGYETESYESGPQLLERIKSGAVGCILLDLDMPQVNGLQIQARLSEMHASLPIIFLSGRGNIAASVKAVKAGAEDFLCKPATKQQLLDAIERAISRNQAALESHAKLCEARARIELLTPRERQVYDLVIAGKMNKQIAYELNTTERTVKAHRRQVMFKLQARSIIELMSFAGRFNAAHRPQQGIAPERPPG
jgi:FixJ family two-component response regulator